MLIGLLRHARAEDQAPTDYHRRLTTYGRQELEKVLDFIGRTPWRPGMILSSPLVRAAQTADQVAARYPQTPRLVTEVLAGSDASSYQWLAADHPDPLLVGHEPGIGAFGARLMGAPAGALPLDRAGFALFQVERLPLTRPARLLLYISPLWL